MKSAPSLKRIWRTKSAPKPAGSVAGLIVRHCYPLPAPIVFSKAIGASASPACFAAYRSNPTGSMNSPLVQFLPLNLAGITLYISTYAMIGYLFTDFLDVCSYGYYDPKSKRIKGSTRFEPNGNSMPARQRPRRQRNHTLPHLRQRSHRPLPRPRYAVERLQAPSPVKRIESLGIKRASPASPNSARSELATRSERSRSWRV